MDTVYVFEYFRKIHPYNIYCKFLLFLLIYFLFLALIYTYKTIQKLLSDIKKVEILKYAFQF